MNEETQPTQENLANLKATLVHNVSELLQDCGSDNLKLQSSAIIMKIYLNLNAQQVKAMYDEVEEIHEVLISAEKKATSFIKFLAKYNLVTLSEFEQQKLQLSNFFGKDEDAERLLTITTNPETITLLFSVARLLWQSHRETLSTFKQQLLAQENDTGLVIYLDRVNKRANSDSLHAVKTVTSSPFLGSRTDQYTLSVQPGQRSTVIPHTQATTTCYEIAANATQEQRQGRPLVIEQPNDALLLIENLGAPSELIFFDKNGTEVRKIVQDNAKKHIVIFKLLEELLKLQRTEFFKPTVDWIETIDSTFAAFERQENVGYHKEKLNLLLTDLITEGLSPTLAAEIIDIAEGESTSGWLLDPIAFNYISRANLQVPEMEKILSVAHSKDQLQVLVTELRSANRITNLESKAVLSNIETAIPGDSIENRLKAALGPLEYIFQEPIHPVILKFCYEVKAWKDVREVSYTEFVEKIRDYLLGKFKTSQAQIDIMDYFNESHMTWKWLYGSVTGEFGELRKEHHKKLLEYSFYEPTEVSIPKATITTTALRYDPSQNAIFFKLPLSKIITEPSLLRYQQMRWQQPDVIREYCLPLEKSPFKDIAALCAIYSLPETPLQQADVLQKVCLRLALAKPELFKKPLMPDSATQALANQLNRDASSSVTALCKTKVGINSNQRLTVEHVKELIAIPTHNNTDIELQKQLTDLLATTYATSAAIIFRSVFKELLESCTYTASGYHGWGADCHTADPFVANLARETAGPLLITTNSYMGAEGTNQLKLEHYTQPISVVGGSQDMNSYGAQLVKGLAELDGLPNRPTLIFGHSMGGHVVLRAALHHGLNWKSTSFLSLQPVISRANFTIPGTSTHAPDTLHYIALLGASSGEKDRGLTKMGAAGITQIVTTPGMLPNPVQEALVQVGRVGVNTLVYNELVYESDPTAAQAHAHELATHRKTFHTHVTPILQAAKQFTPAEKIFLASQFSQRLRIVITQQDDVLKPQFAHWELTRDPAVPQEHKTTLEQMTLWMYGNHYGHLENTVYRDDPNNPDLLTNQQRVARVAGKLFTL